MAILTRSPAGLGSRAMDMLKSMADMMPSPNSSLMSCFPGLTVILDELVEAVDEGGPVGGMTTPAPRSGDCMSRAGVGGGQVPIEQLLLSASSLVRGETGRGGLRCR